MVLDEEISDARHDILTLLASWSGLVADEREIRRPAKLDVAELATFLTLHADWLLAHWAAASFAEELSAAATSAREASRGGVLDVQLGPCVEEDCRMAMAVTRGGSSRSAPVEVRCAAGHVWRAGQWLQLARRIRDRAGTPA